MASVDAGAASRRQRQAGNDITIADSGRESLPVARVERSDERQALEAQRWGGVEVQPSLGRGKAAAVLDIEAAARVIRLMQSEDFISLRTISTRTMGPTGHLAYLRLGQLGSVLIALASSSAPGLKPI